MPDWQDAVNAFFYLGFGFFYIQNLLEIRRDRKVSGCRWGFFTWCSLLSVYHFYYYGLFHQWLSVVGEASGFVLSTVWVAHALYYTETIAWRPWGVPPKKDALPTTALMFDVIGR